MLPDALGNYDQIRWNIGAASCFETRGYIGVR